MLLVGLAAAVIIPVLVGFYVGFGFMARTPFLLAKLRSTIGGISKSPVLGATYWAALLVGATGLIVLGHPVGAAVLLLGGAVFFSFSMRIHLDRKWQVIALRLSDALAESEDAYELERLDVTYQIARGRTDKWSRHYVVMPLKPIVSLKHLSFGVTQDMPEVLSLSALLSIGGWASSGRIVAIPDPDQQSTDGKTRSVSLLLTEPLKPGTARDVVISGMCPDTWSPLRKSGEDEGAFQLRMPARSFSITIILPRGVETNDVIFEVVESGEETQQSQDVEKRLTRDGCVKICWSVGNATIGRYAYKVKLQPSASGKLGWGSRGE